MRCWCCFRSRCFSSCVGSRDWEIGSRGRRSRKREALPPQPPYEPFYQRPPHIEVEFVCLAEAFGGEHHIRRIHQPIRRPHRLARHHTPHALLHGARACAHPHPPPPSPRPPPPPARPRTGRPSAPAPPPAPPPRPGGTRATARRCRASR